MIAELDAVETHVKDDPQRAKAHLEAARQVANLIRERRPRLPYPIEFSLN